MLCCVRVERFCVFSMYVFVGAFLCVLWLFLECVLCVALCAVCSGCIVLCVLCC